MKIDLVRKGSALFMIIAIIFVVGFFLTAHPVSAEPNPPTAVLSAGLQQGGSGPEGWDAFWAQFKVWLEELAKVFAQMPVAGPLLAAILNFIGASNVWFCGAGLFIIFLLGAFAIRR